MPVEWGKDCDMPDDYWLKKWTSQELKDMTNAISRISFDLNVMRCQAEQFEIYGSGPLKTHFDKSPDDDVWKFLLSLKTVKAIRAVINFRPRTLAEFAKYTEKDLLMYYSNLFTKNVIAEVKEKLACFGLKLGMKKGAKDVENDKP